MPFAWCDERTYSTENHVEFNSTIYNYIEFT